MSLLLSFVSAHWSALLPWVYMAATALAITMPEPGTKINGAALYQWLYDAVHQFANLRNPRDTPKQ